MTLEQKLEQIRAVEFLKFVELEPEGWWTGSGEEYFSEKLINGGMDDLIQLGLEIRAGITENPFISYEECYDYGEDNHFLELDW